MKLLDVKRNVDSVCSCNPLRKKMGCIAVLLESKDVLEKTHTQNELAMLGKRRIMRSTQIAEIGRLQNMVLILGYIHRCNLSMVGHCLCECRNKNYEAYIEMKITRIPWI